MDLRAYYKKVRETETTLTGEHLLLVSLATPEGGREGVRTEAPRSIAARLIAEGRARLATEDERRRFEEDTSQTRARQEEEHAARRLQVVVVPSPEPRKSKDRS